MEGLTVPSLVSELLTATETSAVGWLLSLAVKVAVPPASVVFPLMELMVKPGGFRHQYLLLIHPPG